MPAMMGRDGECAAAQQMLATVRPFAETSPEEMSRHTDAMMRRRHHGDWMARVQRQLAVCMISDQRRRAPPFLVI